jgi:hypothetical protein
MAQKYKRRRNPGTMTGTASDEIQVVAEAEIANRLPQLMAIFGRIKSDVSRMVGYDVQKHHPGIDKTIMHVLRQQL